MLYSDLKELKTLLEIDPGDFSEDKKILLLNEIASNVIEDAANRDFLFKGRTVVYKGSGTQKLLLRHRPVYAAPPAPYPALQVTYDQNGNFGVPAGAFMGTSGTNVSLVYGTDFTMQIDQDDGGSRSGILIRINDYWNKPQVRQAGMLSPFVGDDTGSYQVISTAGVTVDTMPPMLRMGANFLVMRLLYLMPLGMELSAESYEERSISIVTSEKEKLMALVKPYILPFRNWKF